MDLFWTESFERPLPNEVTAPTFGVDPSRPIIHEMYFKVHEFFDTSNLDQICREYTNKINNIFSKSTNRFFKYEGVELIKEYSLHGQASFILPSRGFKIYVYLVPAVIEVYGAGLIEGDDILTIINVKSLTEPSPQWIVNAICHEIAHGFGVAAGEYYSIRLLVDFTGVAPEYKVSCILNQDNYWHTPEHSDWLDDPMLIANPPDAKFCWLSSYLINSGKFRTGEPPLPNLHNIRIKLLYKNVPIDSSWDVVVWRNSKIFYDKINVYRTESGELEFPWMAGFTNHWTEALSDNFRIIKVFNKGVPVMATGLSIWDVEQSYIQSGFSSSYRVELHSS